MKIGDRVKIGVDLPEHNIHFGDIGTVKKVAKGTITAEIKNHNGAICTVKRDELDFRELFGSTTWDFTERAAEIVAHGKTPFNFEETLERLENAQYCTIKIGKDSIGFQVDCTYDDVAECDFSVCRDYGGHVNAIILAQAISNALRDIEND